MNTINDNEFSINYRDNKGRVKTVKFISSEYLSIGDYSGAGLLGDCNINAACKMINRKRENITDVSYSTLAATVWNTTAHYYNNKAAQYYHAENVNNEITVESCDTWRSRPINEFSFNNRSLALIVYSDYGYHKLYLRDTKTGRDIIDALSDYPLLDEELYSAAEDAAGLEYFHNEFKFKYSFTAQYENMPENELNELIENVYYLASTLSKIEIIDETGGVYIRLDDLIEEITDAGSLENWIEEYRDHYND